MISALLSPLLKYVAGGLLFVSLMLGLALHMERRSLAKANQRIVELTQLRAADKASYEAAQAQAEAKNQAHVATENKLREQISEESHRNFIADRDRLRAQSGAPQGSAGGSGVSGVPKAAPGTPPEVVSLPPAELLRAQELELQLNELIDWINDQLGVAR